MSDELRDCGCVQRGDLVNAPQYRRVVCDYHRGYEDAEDSLRAENARLREALEAQGLLQKKPNGSFVWHAYDCAAAFDFAECRERCRIARPMIREEWR